MKRKVQKSKPGEGGGDKQQGVERRKAEGMPSPYRGCQNGVGNRIMIESELCVQQQFRKPVERVTIW